MLIGEADAESEVALGICAFELDGDGLLLVARQQDVGVEPLCTVDRPGRRISMFMNLRIPSCDKASYVRSTARAEYGMPERR